MQRFNHVLVMVLTILSTCSADGEIRPTWMARSIDVQAIPDNCPADAGLQAATSDPGPWEQSLAIVSPCAEGSIYALGSHRSSITRDGLEANGALSVGMQGVRIFAPTFQLHNNYQVRFELPERGYYRLVASTGSQTSPADDYSLITCDAQAFISLGRTGSSPLFWCKSELADDDSDQRDSTHRLILLDPGSYEVAGQSSCVSEMTTLEPDQLSIHLRFHFSLTPVPCPADLTTDGQVDVLDLALLLSNLGEYVGYTDADLGDIDGNLWVNTEDLSILLSLYGHACPE